MTEYGMLSVSVSHPTPHFVTSDRPDDLLLNAVGLSYLNNETTEYLVNDITCPCYLLWL